MLTTEEKMARVRQLKDVLSDIISWPEWDTLAIANGVDRDGAARELDEMIEEIEAVVRGEG